jgi:hypothetical protein
VELKGGGKRESKRRVSWMRRKFSDRSAEVAVFAGKSVTDVALK